MVSRVFPNEYYALSNVFLKFCIVLRFVNLSASILRNRFLRKSVSRLFSQILLYTCTFPIDILLESETTRLAAVSLSGKYNPAVRSGGSRNKRSGARFPRANVLDKNAVSLATPGAVFPQRSTATDGDLRRRARSAKGFPSPRELHCIFHGWPSPVVCSRVNGGAISRTGIYCRDAALFTISAERLTSTSGARRKKFSLIKNG